MQFITSGNRIAVENFTVGYLYTITFTNGDYIHTACTGIGVDFVMFTRVQPEYMFALTMDTAANVSTIDIYSEGGGTTNYNELTNKPQINSVELAGNKTLNDLGIQPVINAEHMLSYTLVSGLGTAATTDTTDYATAAQGALADTAVQPAALNDYQTLIDNDNKLSADLVDDTSTTNKFATAAQLDQIETNKNNILSAYGGKVQKNLVPLKFTSTTANITISYTDSKLVLNGAHTSAASVYSTLYLPVGDYWLSGCPSGGGDSTYRCELRDSSGTGLNISDTGSGTAFAISTAGYYRYNVRIGANYTCSDLTISPMIITKAAYDSGDTAYQPYIMSNAEITAWILAQS